MIKKRPLSSRPVCRVTFEIPATVGVTHASVVGDFNSWDPDVNVMKRLKDGRLTATIPLPSESGYAFRYLADGGHWHVDESADALVQNPYGGHDSYLSL